MPVTQVVEQWSDYRSAFEGWKDGGGRAEPDWLQRRRAAAFERFLSTGFPSPHEEAWRYTNVAPIAGGRFEPPADASRSADVGPWTYPGLAGPQLVFLDGRFAPGLSRVDALPRGAHLGPLGDAVRGDRPALGTRLGRHAADDSSAFVALNTALFADGALLEVDRGVVIREPIHLLFVASGGHASALLSPRTLLVIGEGAQATLIETYAGPDGASYFTNAVTEILLADRAVLDHTRVQREGDRAFHVATAEVVQGAASHFASRSVSFGAALARTDLNTRFEAPGGECALDGLYVMRGEQHVDNHTSIDHAHPHCTSREFYKGILDDRARGVFYGRIIVRPDAQKTNASQTNKNLVLSDGALADSIPALEIRANDVKCSHGSSTGQLDRDALFYLRARGISAATARSLLTYAFARDVLGRVRVEPVRAKLDELLLARLPDGRTVREAFHDV